MFSPQKCREDSQAQPHHYRTHHACVREGFSQREFSYFTKMSGCCTVGLPGCEQYSILLHFIHRVWCVAQKKAARSTMSVGFIVFLPSMEHCPGRFSQPRPLLDSVCVRALLLLPNIFIDIFVCWSHLRPPWVNINLRRQPRPLISWPFCGLSAFLQFTPTNNQQRPALRPLLQYCYDVTHILSHPM